MAALWHPHRPARKDQAALDVPFAEGQPMGKEAR